MKLFPLLGQKLREKFLQESAVPTLEKVEFSRLAKISKGLTFSYGLPKGKFYRHCLYSTIYQTLKDHGALFADLEPVVLQWAEKKKVSGKKVIYAEHGWLPRSTYQLSSKGCNSRSHIKFAVDQDYIRILGGYERLQKLKGNLRMSMGSARTVNAQFVEQPFFLVALQTGNDLNLLYSGTHFATYYRQDHATARLGQALIDHVETMCSPYRLIFTQHPGDRDQSRFKVRPENRIVYAGQGVRTIDLLRHANCCGVIAINSNVLHEALLWEKPALALGELLASQSAESPFSGDLQSFLDKEGQRKSCTTLDDQYLAMRLTYQWMLTDFQNPLILREILSDVDVLVPWKTRLEYGFSA